MFKFALKNTFEENNNFICISPASDKEMPSASDNYDFLPKPKPINPVVAGSFMGREKFRK